MTTKNNDRIYSDEELREMITKMRLVATSFYPAAQHTNCHAFIEFTGLMNEFIDICERTRAAGIDFTLSNTHGEHALLVEDYNIGYLAEKLDCILGPTLRTHPEAAAIFMEKLGLKLPAPAPSTTRGAVKAPTKFTDAQKRALEYLEKHGPLVSFQNAHFHAAARSTFRGLVKGKFVSIEWDDDDGKPFKCYVITDEGRKYLKENTAKPPAEVRA